MSEKHQKMSVTGILNPDPGKRESYSTQAMLEFGFSHGWWHFN